MMMWRGMFAEGSARSSVAAVPDCSLAFQGARSNSLPSVLRDTVCIVGRVGGTLRFRLQLCEGVLERQKVTPVILMRAKFKTRRHLLQNFRHRCQISFCVKHVFTGHFLVTLFCQTRDAVF